MVYQLSTLFSLKPASHLSSLESSPQRGLTTSTSLQTQCWDPMYLVAPSKLSSLLLQSVGELAAKCSTTVNNRLPCQDNVLHHDKPIFSLPLNQQLQQSNSALKMFTGQYKDIRLHKEQLHRQHRDIATYFIKNIHTHGSL